MLTFWSALLVTLSLPTTDALPKCASIGTLPGFPDDMAVALVDGEILRDGLEALDATEAYHVEIACWDPETGEFSNRPGVQVVLVVTKSAVEAAKEPLKAVLSAQVAYAREHDRWATTMAELQSVGLRSFVGGEVELTVDGDAWQAQTTDPVAPATCVLTAALAEPAPTALRSDEIHCVQQHHKASDSMRRAWEAGG